MDGAGRAASATAGEDGEACKKRKGQKERVGADGAFVEVGDGSSGATRRPESTIILGTVKATKAKKAYFNAKNRRVFIG